LLAYVLFWTLYWLDYSVLRRAHLLLLAITECLILLFHWSILMFDYYNCDFRYTMYQTKMWRTWRRNLRKAAWHVSVYSECDILRELH
jgi:hypothetical protein